jgi:hypothetical protein
VLEKFWEQVGEELAGQWTARTLAPAFAFWAGGLLAWIDRYGWERLAAWWAVHEPHEQAALLVGTLLGVTFTAAVMERLPPDILRLVEGYWPRPVRWLRFALARLWVSRLQRRENRWQTLAEKAQGRPETLSPRERAEYARLDAALARFPVDPGLAMPTFVGNVLRAAEEYPQVRYGLTTAVCWPRLWLLLPEETQGAISAARGRLNEAVGLFAWGMLFPVWTVWAWWAAVAGLALALLAYRAIMLSALVYGELVRSAFDLYRLALYEHLCWPPPGSPDGEVESGRRLTEYLFRGAGQPMFEITG